MEENIFYQTCYNSFKLSPFQWQKDVGGSIIRSKLSKDSIPIKLLLVRPTGGGKSLVFYGVGASLKGVSLFISPLLSLGANQARKLLSLTPNDRNITGFHVDELNRCEIDLILDNIKNLRQEKSLFLFASPQSIVIKHKLFFDEIISLKVINFIAVDEIHLVSHFGNTFRCEFNMLKRTLFNRIKHSIPMMFMTATCSKKIISTSTQRKNIKPSFLLLFIFTHLRLPSPAPTAASLSPLAMASSAGGGESARPFACPISKGGFEAKR